MEHKGCQPTPRELERREPDKMASSEAPPNKGVTRDRGKNGPGPLSSRPACVGFVVAAGSQHQTPKPLEERVAIPFVKRRVTNPHLYLEKGPSGRKNAKLKHPRSRGNWSSKKGSLEEGTLLFYQAGRNREGS